MKTWSEPIITKQEKRNNKTYAYKLPPPNTYVLKENRQNITIVLWAHKFKVGKKVKKARQSDLTFLLPTSLQRQMVKKRLHNDLPLKTVDIF